MLPREAATEKLRMGRIRQMINVHGQEKIDLSHFPSGFVEF